MSKYDAFEDEETPYRDKGTLRRLYHDEGMSQSEIADELGCGIASVSRWMNKHNIKARTYAETTKSRARRIPAHYHTNNRGREVWVDNTGGEYNIVLVHRLLAVAEYGFEAVADNHIHHKKNIPWLNTPDNIVPKDPGEHLRDHLTGNARNESISPDNCESIKRSNKSDAKLASTYDVVEKTIRRHKRGNCHHD